MIIHNPILTGSFTVNGTDVASITSSAASITAINSYTASQNILNGTYATTGSNTFKNPQTINSNLTVTGSITAATLVIQTITSSVIYSSGSNVFGNNIANTQVMTGSLLVTGSITQTGANATSSFAGLVSINTATPRYALDITGTNATGSLRVKNTGVHAQFTVDGTTGLFFRDGTNASWKSWQIATSYNDGSELSFIPSTNTSGVPIWGPTAMVIQGSGNVGIGTTSPSEKLHLYNSTAGTATTLIIENNVNNQNSQINFKSIYGGSTAKSFLIGSNISVAAGSWEVYDATAAAARLVITSGGNVNINGSGFSDVKFYVKGSDATGSNYACLFVNGSASNLFNIRNDGAVTVFGSLSKGSGTFKIDHPLESKKDTHQLVHSFVEGPRADLIYRGTVTLVNGTATINIDTFTGMTEGTFVALNRETQFFITNQSGWNNIKGSLQGNILNIEAEDTNSTDIIAWMVVGERQDKHIKDTDWTDSNGKPILEPLKSTE